MKTIDKISQRIRKLPERSQKEVLHFIEFLLSKAGKIEEGSGGSESARRVNSFLMLVLVSVQGSFWVRAIAAVKFL